jgi:hypothetical protein
MAEHFKTSLQALQLEDSQAKMVARKVQWTSGQLLQLLVHIQQITLVAVLSKAVVVLRNTSLDCCCT